jgi:UrcA family protein
MPARIGQEFSRGADPSLMVAHHPETLMTSARIGSRSIVSAMVLAVVFGAGDLLSPAVAAEPDVVRVELKVTAAGLDLSTAQGAGAFLDRLTIAAKNACGGQTDLPKQALYERCYQQAIVDAVRNINQPRLLQAYVARYPSEATQFGLGERQLAAK